MKPGLVFHTDHRHSDEHYAYNKTGQEYLQCVYILYNLQRP